MSPGLNLLSLVAHLTIRNMMNRNGYSVVPNVANGSHGTGIDDDVDLHKQGSGGGCDFPRVRHCWGLVKARRRQWWGCLLLLGLGRAVWTRWTRAWQRNSQGSVVSHHEVVPTLFSIVDPNSDSDYLYALDNPLYDELLKSELHQSTAMDMTSFERLNIRVVEYPELFASVDQESSTVDDDGTSWSSERTSLTLTWTLGKDDKGNALVQDQDLLVLRCGDESSTGRENPIVEAATIAQARATHRFHNRNDQENTWTIPNVPSFVLRQASCKLIMYQKVGPLEYAPSAVVAIPLLDNVSTPYGIHIALTASPDRMLVQFTTGASGIPVVQYSQRSSPHQRHSNQRSIDHASKQVTGESDTYTASDMCQAPANVTAPGKFNPPGHLHTVLLTDLEPNALYEYKVGLQTDGDVIWSDRSFTFTTGLPAGDDTPYTFVVYGDQGCPKGGGWDEGKGWMKSMVNRDPSLRSIHHVGDLSYAQGAAHHWDAWLDMIQDAASNVPLMVAVGNHEYDHESGGSDKDPSHVDTDSGFMPVWGNFGNDSGGECGVPTARRFTMPESGGNGVFWYSYDYGLVHTIVVSSEHDLSFGSPQYRWLESDLHRVDRSVTPWVILESHRPFYEGERYWKDNTVGVAMRLEAEDLLLDYHVDLVIAGHYHAYHRTCDGLYRSICNQGGPMHITVGTAGAHLNEDDVGMFTNDWTAHVNMQTFGYGRISVQNETYLHFEFVKNGDETDPTAGSVLDDVWLVRDR